MKKKQLFIKKVATSTMAICLFFSIAIVPVQAKNYSGEQTIIANNGDETIKNDDEILRTVKSINDLRDLIGLNDYTIDETLNKMALIHSKYMHHSNEITSIEDSSKLYYRGKYPWDRADYLGYKKNFVYEFVDRDYANYMAFYKSLLNEPQTRYILLNPMYTDIGMSVHESFFSIELGGDVYNRHASFIYPFDGQENVVSSWKGATLDVVNEDKNTKIKKSGLPITYSYYGDDIESITNKSFSIKEKGNTDRLIPYRLVEPGVMRQSKNMLTLVPLETYKYDTEYEVYLKFTLNFENGRRIEIEKTVQFRTESQEDAIKAVEQQYMTREKFTERVVTVKELGIELIEPLEMKFNDVDINSTSSIYINTANELGLINGYPDGRFGPTLNVSMEQAYKILVSAYLLNNEDELDIESVKLDEYNDYSDISLWAVDDLKKAKALNIIVDDEGNINPHKYLTRDEFEEIIERLKLALSE